MSADMDLKPMAVCESCWLMDHCKWEPESISETGNVLMRLVGVDVPHKVNSGEVEICCLCGNLTVSGIYEFKDPKKVFFSDELEDLEFESDINYSDFDSED